MFQQFIWERAKTEKKKEAKWKDKLHEKKKTVISRSSFKASLLFW